MHSDNVIHFRRKVRIVNDFNRDAPIFPKQKLTKKLVKELMNDPGPLNLLAVFAKQHYGEFLDYVETHHPEMFRAWGSEAIDSSPKLRRQMIADGKF